MSDEKKSAEFEIASKKVDAIIGFRVHFIVYLGVNALLVLINGILVLSIGHHGPFPLDFWCMWPILGWGFGVLMHYVALRKFLVQKTGSWREEQIQKLMRQAQENKQQ